jgi:toxin ParE1/3/4
MAFQIVWSEIVLSDLRDIVRYIARDDRQVARRFGDLIVSKVESLQSFPRIGRIVPEYREECLRELIVPPLSARF